MTSSLGPPPPDLTTELNRLNHEVGVLAGRASEAHQAWVAADSILRATAERRDQVATQLRVAAVTAAASAASSRATSGTATSGTATSGTATSATSASAAAGLQAAVPTAPVREASTHTVQNILFVLGGLLLGTAAIVFTAVAWTTFGVQGKAIILAAVTLITLALPFVALWRSLRATAETFAGIGLLLVALDGWAAWSVNLFDVTDLRATRYAGIVCAITAVVAIAYRGATRLVGPGFAGLVAAQPVLPLVFADQDLDATGWSLVLTGMAAVNLVVLWRHSGRRHGQTSPYRVALSVIAWIFGGTALGVSAAVAIVAIITPRTVPDATTAAAALVAAAVVAVLAAAISRIGGLRAFAASCLVLSLTAGAGRILSLAYPNRVTVLLAGLVAIVALLTIPVARIVPAATRAGVRVGALIGSSVLGLVLAGQALVAGADSWDAAQPTWSADLSRGLFFTWQLPVGLLLVAVAIAVSVPAAARGFFLVAGLVLTVLAIPASIALVWWATPVLDLAVALLLAVGAAIALRSQPGVEAAVAVEADVPTDPDAPAAPADPPVDSPAASPVATAGRSRAAGLPWASALGALALVLHAIPASLGRVELTAATLTGLVLLGLIVAAIPATAGAGRRLAGAGLFTALVAIPPAVGSWLHWADLTNVWTWRFTIAALLIVVAAVGALRSRPLAWYGFGAALFGAVSWPIAAGLSVADGTGTVYISVGLVALALTLLAMPREQTAPGSPSVVVTFLAALPGGLLVAFGVLEAVATVVVLPYSWLDSIWAGVTGGTGLAPAAVQLDWERATGPDAVQLSDAVTLGLVALAGALVAFAIKRTLAAAVAGFTVLAPIAILVALAALAAPWPAVPAATIVMGLAAIATVALRTVGPVRATIATLQGVFYVAAGLTGLLPQRWSTLAGLGLIVVVAAVIGVSGRSTEWRVAGWLGGVTAALTLAAAAGLAADLAVRSAAFGVLTVAILGLTLGATLRGRPQRHAEAVAVEAASHGGAIVALLLTLGWAGHAASICVAWGVAVGLRALWPGTGRAPRAAYAAVAAGFELLGWWLLLAARDVSVVEAYTLPLAGVALLAGWAALRARPELRSWVSYGPALAAAFLPSLAIVLATPGEPWRRLALGAAALAVVIGGAIRRLRAPTVVGGIVLIVLAIHEIAVWWQLLPGWIPLAIGGVLLVGLAITYERRRRDLTRLIATLSQMH